MVVIWGGAGAEHSATMASLAALEREFPGARRDLFFVGSAGELATVDGTYPPHQSIVVGPDLPASLREAMGRRAASGSHTIVLRAGETLDDIRIRALAVKSGTPPRGLWSGAMKSLQLLEKLEILGFTLAGNLNIDEGTIFEGPVHLPCGVSDLGPSRIGAFTYSSSPITEAVTSIGRYCSIAEGVQFGAAEHPTGFLSTSPFQYNGGHMWQRHLERTGSSFCDTPWTMRDNHAPIIIENDVWIGTGAYIKGGVTIGNGAVIGARAVVTRDVPAYAVVVGNPGRVVRHRFSDDVIQRMLEVAWWEYDCADFEGIDVRDAESAIENLERRKLAGELTPYDGFQAPFSSLVETLQSELLDPTHRPEPSRARCPR